ncbi:MAG: riboflavin biosynthesis protein RibD [Actinomycetota bacterium]|jgi:diaminohydroxyphosphoribosylaminopyrimidine deaminase/5-amino-6-(5-phosphoribosylamino)uracil reductase|nr:MAG: riboflavin biosynthesis protein RibD [Actinomycetota bacterium]
MEGIRAHMRRALQLAERGWGRVSPNPMVGAVVLDARGRVVGEGYHAGPGSPHAEVVALRDAGERARGGTLVVTLEPCDHTGRTGPCTREVLAAGIARVVAATRDPNPLVDGAGFRRLRTAGVEVDVGVLGEEAERLNAAFARHVRTGLPFVVLKTAASLDGRTATRTGASRWITSAEARRDAHRLRAWADAIVVGSGTALADDPQLTVREPAWADARPPIRVVVDGRGRVPPTARLGDGSAPTLVATTERAPRKRREAWRRAGAEVVVLDADAQGHPALGALLERLGKRDVQGVLVEGGATLAWGFVRAGLVDRVVAYLAPTLLGGAEAPGVLGGAGVATLAEGVALRFVSAEPVGPDLKVVADVQRDR